MSKLISLIALFISINCHGQTKTYTEKDIYTLFKKSISQPEKGKISVLSNPWLICNEDSSYYNKDTINVFSNTYDNNSFNCCTPIAWTFYEKDKFISTNLQLCKEPTTASAAKADNHFKVLVSSADNFLLLSTFNNDKLMETFKIIKVESVRQDDSNLLSTVITLLRMR